MTRPRRRRIDPTLRDLSERDYQRRVETFAKDLGAMVCHVRKARMVSGNWVTPTSDAGFPDLWILFPETGRLVVLELKRETAGPAEFKPRQREWISGLQGVVGVDAYMARPSDWPHVEALLSEAAGVPLAR